MWWTADVEQSDGADATVFIPEHPSVLSPQISAASAPLRDHQHGGSLTADQHERLRKTAEISRRLRVGSWNEVGVVLVPHAAGLSAYWSDVAETRALRGFIAEAEATEGGGHDTAAIGPIAGVIVAVQTADRFAVLTRRSRRCRNWRGQWGLAAGETLGAHDTVDGALSPRAATLRALDEELAVERARVVEVEPVGLVRSQRSGHHLVTTAHLDLTARELLDGANRARDSWEWDRIEAVPVDSVDLDSLLRQRRVMPTALAALAFCLDPAQLRPVGV